MLNMDPRRLRKALEQLGAAAYAHAEWQDKLLRAIVRQPDFDQHELMEAVNLHCRFDIWYFEQVPAELWGQPAFTAMGTEHARLHRIAAELLRKLATDEPVEVEDFEGLLAGGVRLRLALDTLRESIQATVRNRDALTGAGARAEMLPELREWSELARRQVQPCCIVFMDIDRLKEINDTHGHAVGDELLAGAVRYVTRHLRPYDKVFRYGGDEFLIALPGADLATGQAVIRRIRDGLADRLFIAGPGGSSIKVTASFGLALLDPEASVEDCIERADQALLLAKTAGRNHAISWDPSVTTGTRLRRLQLEDVKS